jgi:hypothetical protein
MTKRVIEAKVERSSLGTPYARAARSTISPAAAAKVVARADGERRSHEKKTPRAGG